MKKIFTALMMSLLLVPSLVFSQDIVISLDLGWNWISTYYTVNNTNSSGADFTSNVVDNSTWQSSFEAHGAVFLPAAGYRNGTSVYDVGSLGCYWSSSYYYSRARAYYLYFYDSNLSTTYYSRNYGHSIRLVHVL